MVQAAVCGTCAHYHQHYVLGGKKFVPLWYGHCVASKLKDRDPDQTCEALGGKPQRGMKRPIATTIEGRFSLSGSIRQENRPFCLAGQGHIVTWSSFLRRFGSNKYG